MSRHFPLIVRDVAFAFPKICTGRLERDKIEPQHGTILLLLVEFGQTDWLPLLVEQGAVTWSEPDNFGSKPQQQPGNLLGVLRVDVNDILHEATSFG